MESASSLVKRVQQVTSNNGSVFIRDAAHMARLQGAAQRTKNKALQSALCHGIGFHNAAMEAEDRLMVEDMFRSMDILVSVRNSQESPAHCALTQHLPSASKNLR